MGHAVVRITALNLTAKGNVLWTVLVNVKMVGRVKIAALFLLVILAVYMVCLFRVEATKMNFPSIIVIVMTVSLASTVARQFLLLEIFRGEIFSRALNLRRKINMVMIIPSGTHP
jgi:hypothetical protein